jgi:hypothetical protein
MKFLSTTSTRTLSRFRHGALFTSLLVATGVKAQGNLGTPQTSCSQTDAFVYQGCFSQQPNLHGGYNWRLEFSGPPRDYPGYNNAVDITVDICLTGCRGHGFKYALLDGDPNLGQRCYCSLLPPANAQTFDSNPNNNQTINTCHVSPAATRGCTGNRNQWCGSNSASDVYLDPSFSNSSTVAQASNYAYLGCYQNQSPGIAFVQLTTATELACREYCAVDRWPYAFSLGADGTNNNCGCGTEIQSNYQLPESQCTTVCDPSSQE